MKKNNSLKNEWDLLLAIKAELENNNDVELYSISYESPASGKEMPVLKFQDIIYLAEQNELEWILAVLHEKYEIVVLTDFDEKSFTIYLPENSPEHIQNFPF